MAKLEPLEIRLEETSVLTKLLRSRKVWVAAISVLTAIVLKLGLPADIAGSVTNLLMVVGTALIGSIAIEDGLTNAGQGTPRTAVDGATVTPIADADVLTARNT